MQSDDIERSQTLVQLQEFPFCAETNPKYLRDHFITPKEDSYVRNHNLVPEFDEDFEDDFELVVVQKSKGNVKQLKTYTISDIINFKKQHSVSTVIACAGNRRAHTRKVYPTVKGLSWTTGAIANNMYRGVLIRDLLIDSGFTEEEIDSAEFQKNHLVSTGLDQDFQGERFSSSIPMSRATDIKNEVILAYAQDGEILTADHGYPLRLVVPGYIGVRNAKWVCKLEISDEEATSHVQRRDYKWITEQDWSKINVEEYESIMGNVPNSCITLPLDEDTVTLKPDQTRLTLKGWATGDGSKGTRVSKVQISLDEGETWQDAKLSHQEVKPQEDRVYSWALWKYHIPLEDISDKS